MSRENVEPRKVELLGGDCLIVFFTAITVNSLAG
jgi:hypothetical protein